MKGPSISHTVMAKYNSGFDLLKFIAAFGVVWAHYGVSYGYITRVTCLAVPAFVFVSLFLCADKISGKGLRWLTTRLLRILLPFWIWSLAYCVYFHFAGSHIGLSDILGQLIFGHTICKSLYFMPLLAGITLVVYCLSRLRNPLYAWAMLILSALLVFVSGSGFNYRLCHFIQDESARIVVGRFVELLPIGIVGYVFAVCVRNGPSRLKAMTILASFLLGSLLIFFPAVRHAAGFGYGGAYIIFFTVAVCFSLWEIGARIQSTRFTHMLGRLSIGVYFLHIMVGHTYNIVRGASTRHSSDALLIFVMSMILSWLILRVKYVKWIVS